MAAVTGRDSPLAKNLEASGSADLPVSGSGTERRSDPRFRIHLPLVVRWLSCSGADEAVTESQDVSSRGIYFLLPRAIKKGAAVEIVMTLPPEITQVGPIKVRYLGRVGRTELRPDHKVGVIAEIECCEFQRGDEGAARGPISGENS